MTWSLSVNGHINSKENNEENEKALARVFRQTIESLPPEDVGTVNFAGNFVNGDLRLLDL